MTETDQRLQGYTYLRPARCRICGQPVELWGGWNGLEAVYAAVWRGRRLDACPRCGEWWATAFHPRFGRDER